jgi:hypothetical protein
MKALVIFLFLGLVKPLPFLAQAIVTAAEEGYH